ncbi:hypothetical protein [Alteribacillus bidgolensis]|uniref:Pentapeptide MXKDX repeat protein n=1 Tax=Alteribacillus bidgolensis TaxID=930129 RepID=A0A1G8R639_9BACI|nr:hypothetical protein [Alteribacillus bidgolensis]SDJ12452.1 hypothetical protein SAMN05216352_1257 [Alteribacillus bidgolensis]
MKNKKLLMIPSFAIAAALVAGPINIGDAHEEHENGGMMNGMMSGEAMGNSNMMHGEGMDQMMEAMNSPEGQEMMNACANFKNTQGEEETTE